MNTLQEYEIDLSFPMEYDSPQLGEPMPPKKIDWKWWITTGIILISLIAGGIWTLAKELAAIDKHIGRVETAVRIVGAKQGGDTKILIDEALSVAKNEAEAGRSENAKRVLDIANRFLAEQQASREQAPQDFFNNTIDKYKKLKETPILADSAWEGTSRLAQYRSAITSVPPGFSSVSIGEMGSRGPFRYLKDSLMSGQNAIRTPDCEGFDIDGWYLDNVVFQNLTICYRGKLAILNNVHFVNCQFEIEKSPRADQLIEAVVKQSANITLS
jgi:hypothetical protein